MSKEKWEVKSLTATTESGEFTNYWLEREGFENLYLSSQDEKDFIEMANKLDGEQPPAVINNIKELPQVAALDLIINSHVHDSMCGDIFRETQKLFWAAVDAINKSHFAAQPTGIRLAGYLFEGRYYKTLKEMDGYTMYDCNKPIPLYFLGHSPAGINNIEDAAEKYALFNKAIHNNMKLK